MIKSNYLPSHKISSTISFTISQLTISYLSEMTNYEEILINWHESPLDTICDEMVADGKRWDGKWDSDGKWWEMVDGSKMRWDDQNEINMK